MHFNSTSFHVWAAERFVGIFITPKEVTAAPAGGAAAAAEGGVTAGAAAAAVAVAAVAAAAAASAKGADAAPTATEAPPPVPPTIPPESPPTSGRKALVEASENLLKHIPGEASGFYLLAVDSIKDPSLGNLGLIFTLALVLLVVVRWLAEASLGIMVTTIVAFAIWMLIFDKGFLHVLLPNLLPAPMGLIVAVFYSTLMTLLASAGKIR